MPRAAHRSSASSGWHWQSRFPPRARRPLIRADRSRWCIRTLRGAVAEANADAGYRKLLASQGGERLDLSPADITAFVRRDQEAMSALLDTLNLRDR